MSWSRSIQVSPFRGSCSPPITGRSLSSICVDINSTLDQDGRRCLTSPHDWIPLSPSLSPSLRILNKNSGSRSVSPRFMKLENSRIFADDAERKSRKLQNHLCLKVLDGETNMLKRSAPHAPSIKVSLNVILEQEKEKRKAFRFPEAGKFITEDENLEELSEKELEDQMAVWEHDGATCQILSRRCFG